MLTIGHIVNPLTPREGSDLHTAQPVTFETMRRARRFAAGKLEVDLLTAQYAEDRPMAPAGFRAVPDLQGSALDMGGFRVRRKLPFLKDILDRLYEGSEADVLVYSNVDIALQPSFYLAAGALIEEGYDAFAINRRTIPAHYKRLEDIPLMCAEIGERHAGWDCFVFRRSLYPRFDLGRGLVGSGWIGRIMLTAMAAAAEKFHVFTDLHLTFHIGNRKAWKSDAQSDYLAHNREECGRILARMEEKSGPLDRGTIPGRFLDFLEKQRREEK